jgi:nitrite reductase/ring-hydroxylating ferredoxin subunit
VSRFPFPPFPAGWFRIADAAEVPPGAVLPRRAFGRDLVCYRGRSGALAVVEAFCPHNGAHLGDGGRVEGDDLVCPFHGWRFDAEGVDLAHFRFVHGVRGFRGATVEADGARFRSVADVVFPTPRGEVAGQVESELWGLGIDVVRRHGLGPSCPTVVTLTPIDEEDLEVRYTFLLPRGEDGGLTRFGQAHVRDFLRQIESDIPIWEHKAYEPRPRLTKEERHVGTFRRWARQFSRDELPVSGRLAAASAGGDAVGAGCRARGCGAPARGRRVGRRGEGQDRRADAHPTRPGAGDTIRAWGTRPTPVG